MDFKKIKQIVGLVKNFNSHNIFINVNYLEKGNYNLKIVHKSKVIKSTRFTKY